MSEICWSSDQEMFYPDIDYVIDDANVGDIIYKGIAAHPSAMEFVDADDILEMMSERADDEYGEWAEGFPSPSTESVEELNNFLKEWVTKNCPITFYKVTDVEEYVITEDDLN